MLVGTAGHPSELDPVSPVEESISEIARKESLETDPFVTYAARIPRVSICGDEGQQYRPFGR